jgi:hypothetical protein
MRRTPFKKLTILVALAHQIKQGGELLRIGNFLSKQRSFGFTVLGSRFGIVICSL